ncbi:hypothetical protein AAGW05_17860 [Arthrobacter sp. LAPM80]|uniref:hypothetical protein n=1 Tax=Arthrobacter sp. LAPM80 TaxID=3141788 RepID=UPI00398AD7B8
MNALQTKNGHRPEDDELEQASVRDLIVQLALTEEERRNAADPVRIAVLTRREQTIIAALRSNEISLECSLGPNPARPGTCPDPTEDQRFQR